MHFTLISNNDTINTPIRNNDTPSPPISNNDTINTPIRNNDALYFNIKHVFGMSSINVYGITYRSFSFLKTLVVGVLTRCCF